MDSKSKKIVKPALGRGLSALISQKPVPVTPSQLQGAVLKHMQMQDGSAALSAAPEANYSNDLDLSRTAKESQANASLSLIKDNESESGDSVRYLDIALLVNNPTQPRQTFDETDLNELVESIKTLGVLQPVIVRPRLDQSGLYEIVAGERRWRASKRAGLVQVPVIIKKMTDRECLEIALVENIQRANLNPVEEANGYQRLISEFGLSQQEVAERVGKDRASVANAIRILKLPNDVLKMVEEGKLSSGHAKAILSIKDQPAQVRLAKKAVDEQLSVRSLESLVSQAGVLDGNLQAALKGKEFGISGFKPLSSSFPEIVDRLRNSLGTKVIIKHHQSGRGRVEIEYFSEQELDRVVEKICN